MCLPCFAPTAQQCGLAHLMGSCQTIFCPLNAEALDASDVGAVPTFTQFPALLEASSPSPLTQNQTALSVWRGNLCGCGESSVKCVCGFSLVSHPVSPLCWPQLCDDERLWLPP